MTDISTPKCTKVVCFSHNDSRMQEKDLAEELDAIDAAKANGGEMRKIFSR